MVHRSTWMDKDLDALADLARQFFEKECTTNEARWARQQHVDLLKGLTIGLELAPLQ